MIFEQKICSRSLQGIQVTETGRLLQARDLSPFLKSGQILASDHSLGISPVLIDFWKRCANTGPNSFANSFRTLGWSSSRPKAYEGFRPLRSSVTPSFVTTISSMNGADLSRSRDLVVYRFNEYICELTIKFFCFFEI